MKEGICVLCLNKLLCNKVSQNLAKKLDMFYLDLDELVEYELLNPQFVEDRCGKEYLLKLERNTVKRATTFENSLLSLNYTLLNDEMNLKNVKNKCIIIFIELSKENYEKKLKRENKSKLKNILDTFIFDERNIICKQISDIAINADGCSYLQVANKIINELKRFLLNGE